MGPLPPDPYKALGVREDADLKEIKTTYRKLVLSCHPDKFPNLGKEEKAVKEEEFQRVQQAWEILSNDTKRKEYDDEKRIKKIRDEAYKSSPHPSTTRPAPKNYYEYNVNVRTTDPPPSFKPGPPPGASPYSPYQHSSPQFSSSWERDIPTRSSKPVYEEDRKARRTASYEKPSRRDEERRRAADEDRERERERERERDKRRAERDARDAREREKERDKRDRREKALELEARERDMRAEQKRLKKEAERAREKERDKQRRVDAQEKYRTVKKPAYVEHHDESDDPDVRAFMKKKSSSSSKKHSDTPSREKSSRKARLVDVQPEEKMEADMAKAADYMLAARRKGSKSAPSPYAAPDVSFSPQYPNPEVAFKRAATDPPRSRRPSQDEKKFTATVEEETDEDDDPRGASRSFRAPPLAKAQTMAMPKSSTSSPRGPPMLSRAQTMPTERLSPPEVPAAPAPESRHYSKHSSDSRRPRRDSYEYDVREIRPEPRRGGSSSQKVYTIDRDEYGSRRAGSSRYVPVEEMYYTPSRSASGFDKVKMAQGYEHVYQGKYYTQDDVIQSKYAPYAY